MLSHPDEMTMNHIERITRLEDTVLEHGKAIKGLVPSVAAIESHLKSIKWVCVGALAFYLLQKYGFTTAVEKVITKLVG